MPLMSRAPRCARWPLSIVCLWFGAIAAAQSPHSLVTPPNSLVQSPPALREAIVAVWARNPALHASDAQLAAAQARAQGAARPLYNPELEISSERADVDTRSVGLSQTIDWSGKRRARVGVADAGIRSAQALRDQIRQDVAQQWFAGYAAFQVATEQVALGAERTRLLAQFAALAERRFVAGDIPSLERDLAELALQEARAQQAELIADHAKARQSVAAVGGDTTTLPALPRDLPPAAELPVTDAALEALPVIRQAQAAADGAQASITVAQRERRADPTLSLTTGRVTDGPLRDNLVGVALRIPLLVRNTHSTGVTAARAEAEQADAELTDQRWRARAQANEAGAAYNALREAWLAWEGSRVRHVSDRAALLQRLWEAGELSTADYLVQLKQSVDTELTATGLRARVWQTWAEWLYASGGLAAWLGATDAPTSDKEFR
ncbi:MAG: TolC family protein [Tahibacter sp.]